MSNTTKIQRRKTTRKAADRKVVRLELQDGMGRARYVTADVVDRSDVGLGISLMNELKPGTVVVLRGRIEENGEDVELHSAVSWCVEGIHSGFRAGLEFLDRPKGSRTSADAPADATPVNPGDLDYYEVMQLSPNADSDTIERVYRLLAQRYHPDNSNTGSSEAFVRLCEAYRVLGNSENRAQYDAVYTVTKQLRWKIFDQTTLGTGTESEKRKRTGILSLLYLKMLQNPERAFMNIFELEDLLGCPREHLEAALWYLRGKGYIQRGDNGRFVITVSGFEEAEVNSPSSASARQQISAPEMKA